MIHYVLDIIIQFILSALSIPFSISQKAILSEVMDKKDILKANGIMTSIKSFFKVVGPTLAGVIVAVFDIKYVFYINAITFFISGLFIWCIKSKVVNDLDGSKGKKTRQFFLGEYKDAIKQLMDNKMLKYVFISGIFVAVMSGANNVLILAWIQNFLHGGSKEYGLLTSALAIGSLVGSVMISRSGKDYNNFKTYNLLCILRGVTYIVLFT